MKSAIRRPLRSEPHWYAFVIHRISGLLLALFLPVHFFMLSLALTQPQRFAQLIAWTDNPIVKIAEALLVLLLAAHFFGGIRVLVLELLPWPKWQKTLVALSISLSFLVAMLFLLKAL